MSHVTDQPAWMTSPLDGMGSRIGELPPNGTADILMRPTVLQGMLQGENAPPASDGTMMQTLIKIAICTAVVVVVLRMLRKK